MFPPKTDLEAYILDLEKQLTEARHQRDEQAARCRAAAQALIDDVGADGPMSLEQVVERTRARLADLALQLDELADTIEG